MDKLGRLKKIAVSITAIFLIVSAGGALWWWQINPVEFVGEIPTDPSSPTTYLVGVSAFLITLFLFSPIYALRSAEATDRGEEWFIIFTFRRANRLLQRDKNERPVDYLGLIPPGKTFKGDGNAKLPKEDPRYWELYIKKGVSPPVWIRIHKFWFVRLWMRYVNLWVDVGLVGVRRIFSLHWYEIEKTRYEKVVEADASTPGDRTLYRIKPPAPLDEPEISNHVRTAPFQWVVPIVGAKTKDRLSWDMLLVAQVRSVNPWLQLNNHESWSQFLSTTIADAAVRGLRDLTIDEVVGLASEGSKSNDEARDKIISSIYHADDRLKKVVGLAFDEVPSKRKTGYSGSVQILYINAYFANTEDRLSFTQPWRAEQEAAAERSLGDAEAYRESHVIDAVAAKVKEHGDAGQHVQRMQTIENAAKFGNSLIFDTANQISNDERLLALIEQRLRQRNGENVK